jgi:hypothetical protein
MGGTFDVYKQNWEEVIITITNDLKIALSELN